MGLLECLTGQQVGGTHSWVRQRVSAPRLMPCGDVIHVQQMAMVLHARGDETQGLKLPPFSFSEKK